MKTSSVSLLLGVCVLLLSAPTVSAVSLYVSPNHQQFFKGDCYVYLSCVDDGQTADGWRVKRTRGVSTEGCSTAADFRRFNNSFCVLDLSVSSGGSFWCENSSGQKSDEVSIAVSEKQLILEIPALPVNTGSNVTLLCKPRNGSAKKSYFFRDKVKLGHGPEGKWILHNVQQSDEGLYSCSTLIHQSPQSRLKVKEPPPPPHTTIMYTPSPSPSHSPSHSPSPRGNTEPSASSSLRPRSPSVSVLRLFCHLLVFCPYFISTILLLLICCSRK
ncbi:Fc receptor-like protein 5 isoform X2 [Simochromis diagramma]|uniref:Fc receptor-like protein 5 isoform X2 n=1 Tax=Simochromis diagramma TaxID=43689 RepID=UPI001A7EAAB2|nr:Fc receptor-like protein 5 isoform X2 [Simochromis diagramma]